MTNILQSVMFGKAAAALFIAGITSLPKAISDDLNNGEKMPRTATATAVSGLGMIGMWANLFARFPF